jgi:hypothetical protein
MAKKMTDFLLIRFFIFAMIDHKQSREGATTRGTVPPPREVSARISVMNFDHWRDRYGWIIGALIILTTI